MIIYSVTIRSGHRQFHYTEIGQHCCDVHMHALERFGLCYVFVKPI